MLARELRREGVRTKRGKLIDKGYLYKLLNNRTYLGLAVHKGTAYPGEHAAIIDQALWDKVHAILAENTRTRSANTRAQTPALLKGLIFGPTGAAMSPTHTRKGNRLYRYYVSQDVLKRGPEACPVGRVPAAEIEAVVIDQLRGIFRQPEIIVGTWRAARAEQDDITEDEAREALLQLDPLWDELFPAEQARIVQLLVERVDVGVDGVSFACGQRPRRAGARGRGHRTKGCGMSAERVPSAGDRPQRTNLADLGVNVGRMQQPDEPAFAAEAGAYRVVIDVHVDGEFHRLLGSWMSRSSAAPRTLDEDELVQISHRPIPDEWLDRPIGYRGDGSVADLLAEVIVAWPT